jgi:hypothetical protein
VRATARREVIRCRIEEPTMRFDQMVDGAQVELALVGPGLG